MASSHGKTLCDHSRKQTTKHPSKSKQYSLLLKDYLRDDLSSCSSNGFKSLPRKQCFATVGFKLQRKWKNKRHTLPRQPISSSCSSKISVLNMASEAVIKAIKSLPLSRKSGKLVKTKKAAAAGFLSRSFSRKLLWRSRRFWRKASAKEEEEGIGEGNNDDNNNSSTRRWRRSFRELLMEERDKTTSNEDIIAFTVPSTATSSSGCGSKSWGFGEFTFSSSVTSSESSAQNDVVQGTKEVPFPHRHKIAEVTTRDWPNEEKEQFSPLSILDCPFEDDEEITSHFNSTPTYLLKGDQHKHTQKRRHFKSVTSLVPVILEKRIQLSELEDETHNHYAIMCTQNVTSNVLHHNLEDNASKLLNFVKSSIPSNCLIVKAENLMFDYIQQSIGENNDIDHSKKLHLCEVAEDWINEQPQELYSGWEVKEGRKVYIREMDREWKNSDQEITQQLAVELENEVITSLVNELVHDLTMQHVSSSIVFSLL